jgi:hypothetical protein
MKDYRQLSIYISDEQLEQINIYAANKRVSRNEAIRQIISNGFDKAMQEENVIEYLKIEFKKIEERDNKNRDRFIKILIKNQKYILSIFHMLKTYLIYWYVNTKGVVATEDNTLDNQAKKFSNYVIERSIKQSIDDDTLQVKRVTLSKDKYYSIISDNISYSTHVVDIEDTQEEFYIIGKVVAVFNFNKLNI